MSNFNNPTLPAAPNATASDKFDDGRAKHTPGPWKITESGASVYAVHHNGDFKDGKPLLVNRFYAHVEDCRSQGGSIEEAKANALLIAAAPDLLAALEHLLNETMYRDHPAASQQAIDAIAKATGNETP